MEKTGQGLLKKAHELRKDIAAHDLFYTQKKLWQAAGLKDYTYIFGGFGGSGESTIIVTDGKVTEGEHITVDDIFEDIEVQARTLGFVKETVAYDEVNHVPLKWNYASSHFYTKDFAKGNNGIGEEAVEEKTDEDNDDNIVEFDQETFDAQRDLWIESNVKNYQCMYGASGEFEFSVLVKDGKNVETEDGLTIDSIFRKIEKSSHDINSYSGITVKYDEVYHIPLTIHFRPRSEGDYEFDFYVSDFEVME